MTNYENIMSEMTIEKLAEAIVTVTDTSCENCPSKTCASVSYGMCMFLNTGDCIEWLNDKKGETE